jgi:very-short-patch-repair endonuclease
VALPHEISWGGAISPEELIARVAARQHGAFTKAQARAAGYTLGTIRQRREGGRWTTLYPGIYAISGSPDTWEQRVIAVTLLCDGVASSITAAALRAIMDRADGPIHVTVAPGQRRRKRRGIVVHEAALIRTDIRRIDNIPVTGPERTIIDVAALRNRRLLEATLDDTIQHGLTTIPKLARYINERNLGHLPGMRTLRKLLDDRARGAMHKELERMFRRKLKAAKLPEPARQYPVGGHHVDFVYRAQKIAIELDGLGGHFSAEQFRRNKRRDNQIVLAGFDLFHFTWEDVDDRWDEVESTLRRALALPDSR